MTPNKLIINAALTGMVIRKTDTPHIPITPEEIAADAKKACDLGASILHIHARDKEGAPTTDIAVYREIINRIREVCGGEIVIAVTTSGRYEKNIERRMSALNLDGDSKPDMASLTLGSMNFIRDASVNAPETIRQLAEGMKERQIKPELEVFDYGMAHYASFLQKKEILGPDAYANLLLGSLGTAPAEPRHLVGLAESLPEKTVWAATGIGRFAFEIQCQSIAAGGHVRVGMEDGIFMDAEKSEPATNKKLVQRVRQVAEAMNRPIASPVETRILLGL